MGSGETGETEPGVDLFDRWLFHRQEQSGDKADEETAKGDPTSTAVSPSRKNAATTSAADQDVADPLFDESFVTNTSEPTLEEPPPPRTSGTDAGRAIVEALAEPVEPTPPDFEPVIIASVRKKAAGSNPEASTPGRTRAKSTRTTPSRPETDAARAVLSEVAAEPKPRPLKAPAPKPQAEPKPEVAVAPKSPEAPGTLVAPVARKSPVAPAAARKPANESPSEGPSTNVVFTPCDGTRRLVGLLLLVALAATVIAGYFAKQDPSTLNLGIAGTLGVLTMVIWAVRAGSSIAHLSVTRGQLEILRGGGRNVFDLSSRYTPIEVIGNPGERGWKVLFLRRSMSPFVIDSSMVDPVEFMTVLRTYRPE